MVLPRHSALGEWDEEGVEAALADLRASGFQVDSSLQAALTQPPVLTGPDKEDTLRQSALKTFKLETILPPAPADDVLEQVISPFVVMPAPERLQMLTNAHSLLAGCLATGAGCCRAPQRSSQPCRSQFEVNCDFKLARGAKSSHGKEVSRPSARVA